MDAIERHQESLSKIEEDFNDTSEKKENIENNIEGKAKDEQKIPINETDENPYDIAKDIMKIMTINAILSTSNIETIKNPTIVEYISQQSDKYSC